MWMTNTEVLAAYDANQVLTSIPIRHGNATQQEWAGQIIVMETMRQFHDMGISVEDYNNMSDADWELACETAKLRAEQHPTAPVRQLPKGDVDQAYGIGSTYFEHGYQFIIDRAQDTITFQYQP
jgi:hypothetical protein